MKKLALLAISSVFSTSGIAADWDGIPVPASAGAGKTWQLQDSYSDSFNYTGKPSSFTNKWKDTYFNGWTGPGLTHWSSSESWVSDGNLIISASRRQGTNKVNAGVITSKTKVKYPIFMEARIKVSNLELSSNFWLLSENDEREIDILEVYGGASDTWFAKNMSTNFHVFFRNNQTNAIISDFNDQTHNTPPWGTYWRDGFHRFGAYWKSPTEVTFYINGQQTSDGSWAQAVMKDKDYTGAILDKSQYNMDEEMFIILDTEDHDWRSNQGIVASDADLANGNKNKMYVDWIRVYKPVATGGGVTVPGGFNNLQAKHSNKCIDVANGAMTNGTTYHQWGCSTANVNQGFKLVNRGNNEYTIQSERSGLCLELANGSTANGATIHQWVCNAANNNQRWTLHDKGDDYFEIHNKVSGKCVDVAGQSTDNGANIVQWNCFNGNNQRFKFLQ
ncbi:beta-agarase [Saccharobesus litoralis]|uniref:Beta-agarase n=1 Tax=Saccharobesus litoralis TaxID=2172099 RepID=A0A2S0VM74_9ALTE|nr:RICIN domain-containing protein [Saccharobesus litoralis]AWB65303.1 beta-agarase [Saccharobesus litoralis]